MRPGRAADHSPRSSAAVKEELGHIGPVMGKLSLYIYIYIYIHTYIYIYIYIYITVLLIQ